MQILEPSYRSENVSTCSDTGPVSGNFVFQWVAGALTLLDSGFRRKDDSGALIPLDSGFGWKDDPGALTLLDSGFRRKDDSGALTLLDSGFRWKDDPGALTLLDSRFRRKDDSGALIPLDSRFRRKDDCGDSMCPPNSEQFREDRLILAVLLRYKHRVVGQRYPEFSVPGPNLHGIDPGAVNSHRRRQVRLHVEGCAGLFPPGRCGPRDGRRME